MPNCYYVRDNAAGTGTATGDGGRYTTPQTGDWDTTFPATTSYYASISALLATVTTPPTAGDVIVCSNIHNTEYGASTTISIPNGVTIISVDDTSMATYLAGAKENAITGAYNLIVQGSAAGDVKYIKGVSFYSGNDCTLHGATTNQCSYFEDGTIGCTGTGTNDQCVMQATDGCDVTLINTDLEFHDTSSAASTGAVRIAGGQKLVWKGGAVILGSGTNKADHAFSFAGTGGGHVECEGVDFTQINAAICDIDSTNADSVHVILKRCIIPSGVTLNTTSIQNSAHRIEVFGCGTSGQYYSKRVLDYYGSLTEETTIVRTGKAKYDGTNEISLKVSPTAANCVNGSQGLRFLLGGKFYDLTTARTVTVFLIVENASVAATALNVNDVQMRVTVNNNTSIALADVVAVNASNPLTASPAALTTDSSGSTNWEGETAANAKYYKISYNIGALSSVSNGLVEIEIEVMATGLAGTDQIYVCPDFDITTT